MARFLQWRHGNESSAVNANRKVTSETKNHETSTFPFYKLYIVTYCDTYLFPIFASFCIKCWKLLCFCSEAAVQHPHHCGQVVSIFSSETRSAVCEEPEFKSWEIRKYYPLVMANIAMEMEVSSWENHLFLWVMASMAMLNNQMVLLNGGLEHGFYFSIYRECHHPSWRTHIFQRGRSTTNQYCTILYL